MTNPFRDYFASYAQCYDDFDAERLAPYFHAPSIMVRNGAVTSLSTAEDVRAFLRSFVASYRERGLKKSNLVDLEVQQLGHYNARVTVHWIIDHVNGSVLRDFSSSYTLFRNGDAWQILLTTNHDPAPGA